MVSRSVRALEDGALADASNRLSRAERLLDEAEVFRADAYEKLERAASYDPEKLVLVIAEIQMIKSQIFYLQQSILQLRTHDGNSSSSGVGNFVAYRHTCAGGGRGQIIPTLVGLHEDTPCFVCLTPLTCVRWRLCRDSLPRTMARHVNTVSQKAPTTCTRM